MRRLLLIVLALVVLAALAIPIARRHMHAESGMTNRHGVRATFAALAAMVGGHEAAMAVPPTTIGVNLVAPTYYGRTRAFANLAIGSAWGASDHSAISPESVDANGTVKQVPSGISLGRALTPPSAAKSATIRCIYQGKGDIKPTSRRAQNVRTSGKTITFDVASDPAANAIQPVPLQVNSVDPTDPIRDLDCRETSLPPNARFDPAFVAYLRGFKVIRFMDWMQSNRNEPVTWATRHTPRTIDIMRGDGVSIEDMIELTKETGAAPWFNMPWNADDDYYEHFARMVHDTLPADRTVYVELGNEIWNMAFKASRQAIQEGQAAGLSPNGVMAGLYRYAEKSAHVLDIWAKVYADRPGKLVRVVACQNGGGCAKAVLGYRDTARHVDALATAPYFGNKLNREKLTTPDEVFAKLDEQIDWTVGLALQAKAVAAQYSKRYISYEAGQHLIFRDVKLGEQVERDPRMYDAYKRYLDLWRTKIGDLIMMYSSSGPISRYGAWGLAEYVGQPLSDAPKLRAVRDEMAIIEGAKAK